MVASDELAGATPAAGVAIFGPGGALLLGRHTHDDRWATFGGAVEEGEDARHAALREVFEETGLAVEDLALLGEFGGAPTYTVHYADGSAQTYHVTMFCSIMTVPRTPHCDGVEIAEAAWFSHVEVGDVALAPDMVEIVPAAYEWFRKHRPD